MFFAVLYNQVQSAKESVDCNNDVRYTRTVLDKDLHISILCIDCVCHQVKGSADRNKWSQCLSVN